MNKIPKLHVRVPASTANLGPAFDCLGLAFQVYNECIFTFDPDQLWLPEGEDQSQGNLVLQAYQAYGRQYNMGLPAAQVEIRGDIPRTRGLGSSAACIAAGLTAAALVAGDIDAYKSDFSAAADFDPAAAPAHKQLAWVPVKERANTTILDCLLSRANDLEGHPDNASASLLGGLCLAKSEFGQPSIIHPPLSDQVSFALFLPDFELATAKARQVLPEAYDRKAIVANLSSLAFLLQGLASGDFETLRLGLQDQVHQPYRFPLIPQARRVMAQARRAGAAGTVISGAGPCLLSLLPAGLTYQAFAQALADQGDLPQGWTLQPLTVDEEGTVFRFEWV